MGAFLFLISSVLGMNIGMKFSISPIMIWDISNFEIIFLI